MNACWMPQKYQKINFKSLDFYILLSMHRPILLINITKLMLHWKVAVLYVIKPAQVRFIDY